MTYPSALIRFSLGLATGIFCLDGVAALALPPPEDIPEEVLRTEIILEARSPIDGAPLTPAEYAELQAQLEAVPENVQAPLTPEVRNVIRLLRLRRVIRSVFPFLMR